MKMKRNCMFENYCITSVENEVDFTGFCIAIHISKTCNSAFYYLYNLRHIRKYLSKDNPKTLIHAFISSRVDYCNSLLYGLPEYQLNKLQRVQNMCARLICNESKYCHITPLLVDLHWLPVKFRIEFKSC